MAINKIKNPHTAFEKLHAVHRIIICFAVAAIVYFFTGTKDVTSLTHLMIGWDTFSLCMLIFTWITFKITTPAEIRRQASLQDSSRLVIFIIVLISTMASFFAVLILLTTKNIAHDTLDFTIAICGMLFSWLLVHTIFAMRYAHIYYGDQESKPNIHAGGLEFPKDDKPGYIDFAYFSFVLGMTFQVSDVEISSKNLRKLALLHGILSFGFNTVIVALTINVVAGLRNS